MTQRLIGCGVTVAVLTLLAAGVAAAPDAPGFHKPLVIAHRGASGYRPEHTLAAYELAIEQGADFIEPDVVSTRDGVLVARHENEISGTTDVASRPEFAARRATKTIDGKEETGWFVEDFTLAELKTLRACERLPDVRPKSAAFDGQFQVPTIQEVLELAKRKSKETGRVVGVYPETKHPTYHRSMGLPLEEKLVALLKDAGYAGRDAPAFLQSFEVANLKALRRMTDTRLVLLIDARATAEGKGEFGRPYDFVAAGDARTYGHLLTPAGLKEVAAFADGIGPPKGCIVPADGQGRLLPPTTLVRDAHAAGLLVHAYTFRAEPKFLPAGYGGDALKEYEQFFGLGIDGVFSDQPDLAVKARSRLAAGPATAP
jgi:glycerophosphoryl diester phosphodiesterase